MRFFNKYFNILLCFWVVTTIPQSLFAQNNDEIKAIVQNLSSDTDKVNTLLDLSKGISCVDSGKKLAMALEALRIADNKDWKRGIRISNNAIGVIYFQCKKDTANAFRYFNANVQQARKDNDIPNIALAIDVIAKEYGLLNQHQKAIEYYYEELGIETNVTRKANIFANIGTSYKAVGDYQSARNFYDSSIYLLNNKKDKDLEDTLELAGVYINKGEVFLSLNQPDKALDQYDVELKKSGAVFKDRQFYIWGLIGMGKAYRLKHDYAKAIENYTEALRACRPMNNFEDEVSIEGELSNTYLETGDASKALSYADSSLSLAETQHYINLLSRCNTVLAKVYIQQRNFDLAISYLKKALDIAEQTKNLEDQRDAYGALKIAYKNSGQFELALFADEKFKALSDSLYNLDKLNAISRTEMAIDYKNKRRHDSLTTQIVFAKKIEQQRVLTYSGFIGLVLVIALAFFMYRNYKTQKKYNELLNREKQRHLAHIEAQSNVLSEISHIQAHQIRGPVSTILGLVHIYNYEDAADPMNKQVMEWITSTTEKLDVVIKDIIVKENNLRTEHEEGEASAGTKS